MTVCIIQAPDINILPRYNQQLIRGERSRSFVTDMNVARLTEVADEWQMEGEKARV